MLRGFAILLLFQLAGECIAFLLSLPVPGPVIGMVLLFLAFLVNGGERAWLADSARSADILLARLGLFFVPAGVGVVALWAVVKSDLLSVAIILVGSTLITLIVTVWAFIGMQRALEIRKRDA